MISTPLDLSHTRVQALDFKAECDSIAALLEDKSEREFQNVTLFKGWSVDDIIGHLHLWNIAADQSINDPDAFMNFLTQILTAMGTGKSHVQTQNDYFGDLKGRARFEAWRAYYPDMAQRVASQNPERRVKWAGPDMSVRSCIIARQMEHWAHAQAIFDRFDTTRTHTARLKNVAHIGVTTYSWSFKVKRRDPLLPKPYVRLIGPDGEIWEWNAPQDDNKVEGTAEEFCQIVTQCRNVEDTHIRATGEAAATWMRIAQCFAGGAQTPPAKGLRKRHSTGKG